MLFQLLLGVEFGGKLRFSSSLELFVIVLGRLRLDLFLDLWKKVIKIVACEHLFSVLLTVLCWH